MIVLGVYPGHDSAAALVIDGRLVAAAEEERYTRQKHYLGWPEQAINYCLGQIPNSAKPDQIVAATPHTDRLKGTGYYFIDHHKAHAYYAYRCSGFNKAKVLVLDGGGDRFWAAAYEGEEGLLELISGSPMRNSTPFGMVYAYVTEALGFRQLHDEGKVMGLAARGNPERYRHLFEGLYTIERYGFASHVTPEKWQWLLTEANQANREDMAAALQDYYERMICEWVEANVSPDEDLCVAGGVFANVKINGLLLNCCNRLFVAPAMNDGGLAAGAALSMGEWLNEPQYNTCLGDDLGQPDTDPVEVAKWLYGNKTVGIAWGRMEYGPRALGRRSVLAPAHSPAIARRLNDQLQRNDFMPFAPVILDGLAGMILEGYEGLDSQPSARHMTLTYRVRDEWQERMAAVVHIDGTVRPQIVTPADGWYYEVVKSYCEMSGYPALINTSFNSHGEPIVRARAEATAIAARAGLDYLVTGKG